jgi:hypothetical protein
MFQQPKTHLNLSGAPEISLTPLHTLEFFFIEKVCATADKYFHFSAIYQTKSTSAMFSRVLRTAANQGAKNFSTSQQVSFNFREYFDIKIICKEK